MYKVGVRKRFSAAHRLLEYNGNCEQLHGHNFVVEVTCSGDEVDNLGMLIDFRQLKIQLDAILDGLDHKFLNDLDEFKEKNPSSEHLASYIHRELKTKLSDKVKIEKVIVWESDDSWASHSD